MKERNERVRLAASVRELELANGFLVLARQAADDVTRQVEERRRRVRQSKELLGVFIDTPPAALQGDVVQVRGELIERELARPEVVAQADDPVPGSPGRLGHDSSVRFKFTATNRLIRPYGGWHKLDSHSRALCWQKYLPGRGKRHPSRLIDR